MTFQSLLMFIFAPVLGLLARVRAFAVVAALVCAVGLPVGGSALAQSAEKWGVSCKTDEWDDFQNCEASVRTPTAFWVYLLHYRCDGTGKQSVKLRGSLPLYGFASVSGERESGESFTLRKFQARWDKDPASEIIMLATGDSRKSHTWWWEERGPDWPGWESLEMTPTTLPNPVSLLQTKSQLRIRGDNGPVLTFTLAGAREAIAEAKRGCGL